MTDISQLIADVVALAGGRLVGRTRIQKTIYLLDALGMNSGASYYYYNFGPFSDDVANGISDAKFLGFLNEDISYRQLDGSPFSTFRTDKTIEGIDAFGEMDRSKIQGYLSKLESQNITTLELAATIHWLRFIEQVPDWREELKRRKGAKAEGGRMEKAEAFLASIGLS